jgi:hypothetical protein
MHRIQTGTIPGDKQDDLSRQRHIDMAGSGDREQCVKDSRLICAYHEAGHAFCGTLAGYRVESMQLFDASARGLQAQTRYASRPKCPTAYADLAVTLAGPIAESVFTARDLLDCLKEGADFEASDFCRAQREAQRLHRLCLYKSPDHALLIAEQRARRMLEETWGLVAKAAQALYQQGRIE